MKTPLPSSQGLRSESGSVLLLAAIFFALFAMMATMRQLIASSSTSVQRYINAAVQADNVARGGLVNALSWFRRQIVQPVRSSVDPVAYPYPDSAFNPQGADTIDATLGLVQEYPLSESARLWARVEVPREVNSSGTTLHAAHDISNKRSLLLQAGDGVIWSIESQGCVYERNDSNPAVAYNQSPNKILSCTRITSEIRRMGLTLPADAAVVVNDRSTVSLQDGGHIYGGSAAGLAFFTGASGPTITSTRSWVTGTPNVLNVSGGGMTLSCDSVFGVTYKELKYLSDLVIKDPSTYTDPFPASGLTYIDGNAAFTASNPPVGGVIFVNGDLTVAAGTNLLFSGFIYVKGNANVNGPSLISGALVVEGTLTMTGGPTEAAEIQYDSGILDSMRRQVGSYRENKAATQVSSGATGPP